MTYSYRVITAFVYFLVAAPGAGLGTSTTTKSPDGTFPDSSSTTAAPDADPTSTTAAPDPDPTSTTAAPDPDPTSTTAAPTPAPTSTTAAPTPASTITTAAPTPASTITTAAPTSATAAPTVAPGCNATLTASLTTSTFTTQNYPSNYDNNMQCHISISSLTDTAIVLTFTAFQFEDDTYCTYDSFSVYDQSPVDGSTTLIGSYCGSNSPSPITSSYNALYIVITTDGSVQRSGASVDYIYIDNSYPNCKANFTSYTAVVTTKTISNQNSPYLSNEDEYFLIKNPNRNDLILQLTAMNIEKASGCTYDRITIYNGACTRDTVLDTHCGNFLKRWELTGTEYLVHFHSDSSIEKDGFTMEYYLGTSGTGAPTTTTTTVGPPLSAEIFLVNDILTNYSTENFPVRNLSVPVEATIEVYLAGVNSLDEVQQKLTTTIQFEVTWYDEGMRWPTTKQSGITKLLIPQNDIWKPDLALINSFTKISAMGHKFMFVVVENDGKCTWKPYQILESTCKADMTDYPYDTQECDLKFSTWSSSSDQVQTIVGSRGMTRHDLFVENSEWHLKDISQRNETINGQLTAVFTLKLKRNHSFIVFYVTIPVVLLSLLNSLTFALPTQAGEKASYAITIFLSFLIYVIVTFQKMPENSDTLSLFAIYVLIMTGMSNLTVTLSVLEIRMMELKTKTKPMLQCTVSFTKSVLSFQHRLLCIKEEMEEKRYLEAEKTEQKKRSKRKATIEDDDDDEDDEDDVETDNTWPDFVSALDFVCFWVFLTVSVALAIGYMVYLSLQ